jgi:urease accessory protein
MQLVRAALTRFDAGLPVIAVPVDRQRLSKRLWRGVAEDGVEFGFDLEEPLGNGDVVAVSASSRYLLVQVPEPLLEIPLDVAPDAAAVIGWAVGNLHFPIEAQTTRILAPDDSGLRQSLDRLGIHYHPIAAVFQPHRFSGSLIGHGHGHGGHSH